MIHSIKVVANIQVMNANRIKGRVNDLRIIRNTAGETSRNDCMLTCGAYAKPEIFNTNLND